MMKKYWVKSALLVTGTLAGIAAFGGSCLSAAIQRILVSTAFD
jgi:hypothetical protein